MEAAITMISNFGFPIACVVFLGVFIYRMWTQQLEEQREKDKAIVEQLALIAKSIVEMNARIEKLEQKD